MSKEIENRSLVDLGLTKKTTKTLENNGVNDLNSLLSFSKKEFKALKGVGAVCLHEIEVFLVKEKLKFKKDEKKKKDKILPDDVRQFAVEFIQKMIYIPERVDMGKEIRTFSFLWKKYPDILFWKWMQVPERKPWSLFYYYSEKGKVELENIFLRYESTKKLSEFYSKQKPNNNEAISFGGEVVTEQVYKKAPKVKDFLMGDD